METEDIIIFPVDRHPLHLREGIGEVVSRTVITSMLEGNRRCQGDIPIVLKWLMGMRQLPVFLWKPLSRRI